MYMWKGWRRGGINQFLDGAYLFAVGEALGLLKLSFNLLNEVVVL